MTACLAVPSLSPWVNTNGVASMLRLAQDTYCGPEVPEHLSRLEERLRALAAQHVEWVERAQVATTGGGDDAVARALVAVYAAVQTCAGLVFGGQDLYSSLLHSRDALSALWRDFLACGTAAAAVAADEPSAAACCSCCGRS